MAFVLVSIALGITHMITVSTGHFTNMVATVCGLILTLVRGYPPHIQWMKDSDIDRHLDDLIGDDDGDIPPAPPDTRA